MIKRLILSLLVLVGCNLDAGSPVEAQGIIGCVTATGGMLSGKCSSTQPLIATISHDGTITGTGSNGSAFVSGTITPARNAILQFFGNSADGAMVLDGTTTVAGMAPTTITAINGKFGTVGVTKIYSMVRDLHATNVTVNSGVALGTNNWRLFVSGTITNNGLVGNPGTNGVGTTGGTGRSGFCCASGAGGGANTGGTASGGTRSSCGSSPSPLFPSGTGRGNAGLNTNGGNATGVGQGGGGAGGSTASGGNTTAWSQFSTALTQSSMFDIFVCGTPTGTNYGLGSGGGGGGASGGPPFGGGGGGAAGWATIVARNITGSGVWSVEGGDGANGTALAGGGGGGGGGMIMLFYNNLSGTTTTVLTGGAGGINTKNGGSGGAGLAYTINMSGDGT